MEGSGIPSARKKLARAKYHLEELRADIRAFRMDDPYEFEITSHSGPPSTPEILATVTVTKAPPEIPDRWALITGDILTNARAALDHAVFPHIRSKKPDLDRKLIQYPIEDTRAQFENKNRWFKRPVYRVVNDSQPYRFNDPNTHPLRILRELVNMDKHRDLVIADHVVADFEVAPSDLYDVVSTEVLNGQMQAGTVVARAVLRPLRAVPRLNFPCEVAYAENIEMPGLGWSKNLLWSMELLLNPLGPLLDGLENAGC